MGVCGCVLVLVLQSNAAVVRWKVLRSIPSLITLCPIPLPHTHTAATGSLARLRFPRAVSSPVRVCFFALAQYTLHFSGASVHLVPLAPFRHCVQEMCIPPTCRAKGKNNTPARKRERKVGKKQRAQPSLTLSRSRFIVRTSQHRTAKAPEHHSFTYSHRHRHT